MDKEAHNIANEFPFEDEDLFHKSAGGGRLFPVYFYTHDTMRMEVNDRSNNPSI